MNAALIAEIILIGLVTGTVASLLDAFFPNLPIFVQGFIGGLFVFVIGLELRVGQLVGIKV